MVDIDEGGVVVWRGERGSKLSGRKLELFFSAKKLYL